MQELVLSVKLHKTALRNKDICSGVNIYRTFYKFEAPL